MNIFLIHIFKISDVIQIKNLIIHKSEISHIYPPNKYILSDKSENEVTIKSVFKMEFLSKVMFNRKNKERMANVSKPKYSPQEILWAS